MVVVVGVGVVVVFVVKAVEDRFIVAVIIRVNIFFIVIFLICFFI